MLNERQSTGASAESAQIAFLRRIARQILTRNSISLQKEERQAVEKAFHKHRKQWLADVRYSSSMQRAALHPSYKKIIELGAPVVQYLIDDMRSTGTHWFIALHVITGKDPIKEEHVGDVASMIQDWVEWSATEECRKLVP
jgi:hypothetical protein